MNTSNNETNEKPSEKKTVTVVPVENGIAVFKNSAELLTAAAFLKHLKLVPQHLINEGNEAIGAALMLCKQFNLPQKAMNQMAFVKGKLTCFGSLVTALAERHPQYGEKREFFLDLNQDEICSKNKNLNAKAWAAVVQIRKKNQHHWTEYFFTLDDAQEAGLLTANTKPDSGWVKYTKDLLMHKARKRAHNAEFASALEGIDYHEDVIEEYELKDVTPERQTEDFVNNLEKLKAEHNGASH